VQWGFFGMKWRPCRINRTPTASGAWAYGEGAASESAASLPWQTIALMSGSASREFGVMILKGLSIDSAAEVLDDDAREKH